MTPIPLQSHRRNQRGFVLLGVMLVMVALLSLAGLMSADARSDQIYAKRFVDTVRARMAAESGVEDLLNQLTPGTPLPEEGFGPVIGQLEGAMYNAEAVRLDPHRHGIFPGEQNLGTGTIIEIRSTGSIQSYGQRVEKQKVTAIVDNGPQNPRVLLWLLETPEAVESER